MRKSNFNLAVFLSSALLLGATSCVVDGDFDKVAFGDINTEMTLLGEGVQLPLGSVEPVDVKSILSANEGLKNFLTPDENGDYSIGYTGSYSLDDALKTLDMSALKDIDGVLFSEQGKFKLGEGTLTNALTKGIQVDADIEWTIGETLHNVTLVSADVLNSIPDEFVSLDMVKFSNTSVQFGITMEDLPNLGTDLYLKNATIVLPETFVLSDGSHVINIPDAKIVSGREIMGKATIAYVPGVDINSVHSIGGDVVLNATIFASKPTVSEELLNKEIVLKTRSCVGDGNFTDPGKIVIESITAKVDYTLEEKIKLDLGDIPTEFKGDNVVLDLSPLMNLCVSTNLNVPIVGEVSLTPVYGGVADNSKAIVVSNVMIPVSEHPSQMASLIYSIGERAAQTNGVQARPCNLGNLLRKIPDSIEVSLKAGVDAQKQCVFHPEAEYACTLEYEMKAPLQPGKDFCINLTPNDISLAGASSYLSMLSGVVLGLKGEVESTLPLGVTLQVQLLDAAENIIAGGDDLTLRIKPSVGGAPTRSDMNLLLSLKERAGEIAALRIKAMIDAEQGAACLNESDYIKIDDLVLLLPEGLTINPQIKK